MPVTALCPLSDLAPGRPHIARPPQAGSIVLLRLETGIAAYRNACPHMGIELDWEAGRLLSRSGRYLRCTGHGALFDPGTGVCVSGPCAGEALVAVPVRVEGGTVVLDG